MNETLRIGLIGVGRMGSGIAGNLLAKGFALAVWDLDDSRVAALEESGAQRAADVAAVAGAASVLVTSLPSTAALDSTVEPLVRASARRSDGVALTLLETSTLPLADKQRARAALATAGIEMLDCPLIGGAMQARQALLTVLASGDRAAFERCLPVLRAISAQQHYIGAFGESTKLKLIVNHLVGITNVLVAETLHLAALAGLDLAMVDHVIGSSPAGSGIWRARAPLMRDQAWDDPARQSAQMNIPLKDNALIADFIAPFGAATPLFDAVLPIYEQARREGRQAQDPAALLATLAALRATALHPEAE